MGKQKKRDGKACGKCSCGGQLRGVREFGRLFVWCEKCTPVQFVDIGKIRKRKKKQ